MRVADILTVDRIQCGIHVTSKKKALETMAEILGTAAELSTGSIVDGLFARERLGSTGLGQGVALPHTRTENLEHTVGGFISLTEPVSYDAVDGMPVDLVFGLMVPSESTEEHLQILADLAALFSQAAIRTQLRSDPSPGEVLEVLQSSSAGPSSSSDGQDDSAPDEGEPRDGADG